MFRINIIYRWSSK